MDRFQRTRAGMMKDERDCRMGDDKGAKARML